MASSWRARIVSWVRMWLVYLERPGRLEPPWCSVVLGSTMCKERLSDVFFCRPVGASVPNGRRDISSFRGTYGLPQRPLISLVAHPCLVVPTMRPRSPLFLSIAGGPCSTSCLGQIGRSGKALHCVIGAFSSCSCRSQWHMSNPLGRWWPLLGRSCSW